MSNGTPTVVPGQTPGTTPPFLQSQSGAGSVNEQTKRILQMLMSTASQRRFAGTPHPSPVPGQESMAGARSIGMGTTWPSAWGFERFAAGMQTTIKNALAQHKEAQIQKAEATYDYYGNLLQNLFAAQAGDNPEAIQAAQQKLDNFYKESGNIKALHNAAKSLNQSWLEPEKTTAYGVAMNRSLAKQKQKDQARSGISNLFRNVLRMGRGPQAELTPEESVQTGRQIQEKVPTVAGTFNIEQVKNIAQLERALSEARQKYQYIPAQDGTIWAVNKNDRTDAHQLRDSDSGDPIKGKTGGKEGQVYQVNGMPVGVFHGGKPVMPGDAEWSERDAKMFDAAVTGAKEKSFLRVEPAIAAMVGDPPNPGEYAKGRGDPAYGAALKKWGGEVFQKEKEKAAAAGESRAIAWNKYRPVQAMDDEGNVFWTTAGKAIEQGQAGAGEGIKLRPREAQISDIEVASKKTRDTINALDKGFTPAQIAKLHYAMSSEDPSLANTELSALATQDLTDKQQDFVVWIRQLNERAMSLRNVAGMGVGAQDLRTAIRSMIPGIRSGNKQMMNKQLDAFDNQVKILKTGIAHPGKTPPKGGTVMMQAPNGQKMPVPADQVEHYKKKGAIVVQ